MNKTSSETTEIVLQCTNLNKSFTDGKLLVDVIKNVNLSIRAGERLAIVGTSGAGKSTLLHLLGGLDTPTSGSVWLKGMDIHTLSEAKKSRLRNQHLGFVYQFHHLLPEFDALENVAMPLLISGMKTTQAKAKAKHMLISVGLEHRLTHRLGELSGGERQRVAIARALANNPSCVLADEPTGNLDHHTANQIIELMLNLNEQFKTSLVIVTHDAALAKKMNYTITMADGGIS